MILINILHVAIDDTDSPDGMCTTYLAYKIIEKLGLNGFKVEGFPRLIRLNPFAKYKTRGNGAVHFKVIIPLNSNEIDFIKDIVINQLNKYSELDCENTNPCAVFYMGDINKSMKKYSLKAIHDIITIDEATSFAESIGADYYKIKKGRGIIGCLAAIGCELEDHTYELLTYRSKENYGKKRKIDVDSVFKMNDLTYPETFENIDGDYIAIEPHTPCPILYGVRGESVEILKKAKDIVNVLEKIEGYCIFKTNQHTDMHLQKVDSISEMAQFGSYIVKGEVKDKPYYIEGGHVFFEFFDKTGEFIAAAYEPTKEFRKIIRKLIPGDEIELYGGIGGQKTFNIEKIKILKLEKKYEYKNPLCKCGKRMKSAGKDKGFKCPVCSTKIRDDKKIKIEIKRTLKEQFYETPISARRHLSKPLIRMNY